jgi:hypothetical protein
MSSRVITPPEGQLTLSFEPGLAERYRSLRECCATGIYRHGLGNVAIDLNKAPGNLSVELSEDPTRHFSVDSLEAYIAKYRDVTPIHYLIDRFLKDESNTAQAALAEIAPIVKQLAPLLKKAGLI